MKKFLLVFGIIGAMNLYSSDETNEAWEINEMSVTSIRSGYQCSFTVNDKHRLSSLKVDWNKQSNILDENKLPNITKPILRRISFLVSNGSSPSTREDILLVIPYNRVDFGIDAKPDGVMDVARLYFTKGNLVYWELSEAVAGSPGKWKLSGYSVESKKHLDEGIVESLLNPYARFDYTKGDWLK